MGISELLLQLADPQAMKSLSFVEKMEGGLIVTFLGMGITFLALILLQCIIDLLARIIVKTEKKPLQALAATSNKAENKACQNRNDEELIAVISAAVAMNLQRSTGDIVIRNIRKIEEPSLLWNRTGVLDQMNTRL
ncbi:MAG: OadG family protein [Desulfoprunum sp.]|nr:OadG family protein [Desulfoprunum sp.]